jgi:hypothetical protein
MRDCDNCPWLGTYRNRKNANSDNNGNANVNITADAEVHLLPPCSRPTAKVVQKGNHLHFVFGFPKCPCCGKKPEKPKQLNIEDCDIEIRKLLNIEDCDMNI